MDTTRKYPRTLQEAFGPYASGSQLHTEYDPMPREDKIVVIACAIAAAVLVVMAVFGWLPGGAA
jgi:hypothetical protein